jgi:hypothetical protein
MSSRLGVDIRPYTLEDAPEVWAAAERRHGVGGATLAKPIPTASI